MILWVGFACLYLLSHRGTDIQLMGLRFLMAIRGKFNPVPNDDPIHNMLVERLRDVPQSPDEAEWTIRMILAKQGIYVGGTKDKEELVGGISVKAETDKADSKETEETERSYGTMPDF